MKLEDYAVSEVLYDWCAGYSGSTYSVGNIQHWSGRHIFAWMHKSGGIQIGLGGFAFASKIFNPDLKVFTPRAMNDLDTVISSETIIRRKYLIDRFVAGASK